MTQTECGGAQCLGVIALCVCVRFIQISAFVLIYGRSEGQRRQSPEARPHVFDVSPAPDGGEAAGGGKFRRERREPTPPLGSYYKRWSGPGDGPVTN